MPATYQPVQNGYAAKGRLKREAHAGQVSGEWQYNQDGQLRENRRFRDGEIAVADQYYYDVAGRLRFIQHFDNECYFSSLAVCSGPMRWTSYDQIDVDNENRMQESRTFLNQSGQWELRSITSYVYDKLGRPIKLLRYTAGRQLASTQEFTYDSQDNVVSMREINTNASTPDLADRTFTYTYDEALNPYVGSIHYVAPFFISRNLQTTPGATYRYDNRGYPVQIWQNGTITELMYY